MNINLLSQSIPKVCFLNPLIHSTFSNQNAIAACDLNNDGNIDLAVANTSNISILKGNGNGSFTSPINYTVGNSPGCITYGFFNSDVFLDLAVANSGGSNVSVLLGTGLGTFSSSINYFSGLAPYSVTTADFNNDGKLDLAVANNFANTASILIGNGFGSFSAPINYTVGSKPNFIISADFNGDNNNDLAVTNSISNSISILLNTGSGSFSSAINFTLSAGSNPTSLVAGDFNGDGTADLAVTNFVGNLAVLLGNGSGSFSTPVYTGLISSPTSIRKADFNNDSKIDLAISFYGTNRISVLLGNGNGSFTNAGNFLSGADGYDLVTSDFNNDGNQDLAVANFGELYTSVLLNTFVPLVSISASTNSVCVNGATISLSGNPSGGVVSGVNISNSVFTPSTGLGNFIASYAYITPNGCANTATTNISVFSCLGVENSTSLMPFTICPNPTSGLIAIKPSFQETSYSYKIFNSTGKEISYNEFSKGEDSVDFSLLSGGMYFIQFIVDNKIYFCKVVKQQL